MSGSKRPEEGTPEYDWLYGSDASQATPADRPIAATDPDATQVVTSAGLAGSDRPDPTQMLPTTPPPPTGPPTGPPPTGRQPSEPPAGKPPKKRRLGRWGIVKVVLLVWLVFLIAVPIWAWTKITKVDADPGGDRPTDQDGTTYLLVGSDSRGGLTKKERRELGTGNASGQRTDTIMLLHIGSGPNLLMSIPRDSLVEVPGYGVTKINAAYAYGGPKLLVKTIEQNTGVEVDNYVEIGLGGLVNVVDAVGGVEICPKKAMKDPLANLNVKKGCQDADGATALGYARSRHTSNLGDIARARHQREVVSAVGDKVASPWSVLNPVRYVRLASASAESFAISEETGPIDMARFGWAMTRVSGETGLTCGVPISDLAVHWDAERSKQLFAHIIDDDTSGISKNLCTPSGLAR